MVKAKPQGSENQMSEDVKASLIQSERMQILQSIPVTRSMQIKLNYSFEKEMIKSKDEIENENIKPV